MNKKGIVILIAGISLIVGVVLVVTLSNTPKTPELHDEPGKHQGVIEYNPDTKPIEIVVKDAYAIETGIIVQSDDDMLIELDYELNGLYPSDIPKPGSTITVLPTEDEQYYRLVKYYPVDE